MSSADSTFQCRALTPGSSADGAAGLQSVDGVRSTAASVASRVASRLSLRITTPARGPGRVRGRMRHVML